MSELKPCPKCGSEDISIWVRANVSHKSLVNKKFYIKCNNCGHEGEETRYEIYAVDAWNRRAT